jgi:GT2 family glycosyltransferase
MGVPVSVVMVTRDRRDRVLSALAHLTELPEEPDVVVVDNGSSDGTVDAVSSTFPAVQVIGLPLNAGASGRNIGVLRSRHDIVAFSDDDSWWEPGALLQAVDLLQHHPRLALVMGRLMVEPEGRLDPTCAEMASSPLAVAVAEELPGPAILGFLACGAVLRRGPFLDAGGFHPAYGVGGEEELLAIDLAAAGWQLAYCDEVVAHHQPAPGRDPARRRRIQLRNALWSTWLRLPAGPAVRRSVGLLGRSLGEPGGWGGAAAALAGLPWVLSERRPAPPAVVAAVETLGW